MAYNEVTGPVTLQDAVAISSTNTVISTALTTDYLSNIAFVLTSTGTATGSAKLQGSIDGTTWVDLPNSGTSAVISVSGANSYMWQIVNLAVRLIRVSYTNATNSGTLTVKVFGKAH
jgi:hypothetical protein